MPIEQFSERFRRKQRDVARKEDDRAAQPQEHRLRCQKRMGRPELWLLNHKSEAGLTRESSLERVRLMADHNGCGRRAERCGGREDVQDHRPAGDKVQHLGPRRFHAGPLTRRKDNDVDVLG